MARIGLIGVGLVGTAIAERLVAAGYAVIGFDVAAERRAALDAMGGRAATSAVEIAQSCDPIILSLPTSRDVLGVLDECRDAIRAGQLWIDTTTGEPGEVRTCGEFCANRGARYVDATILGSSDDVRNGSAVAMIGGEAAAVAEPIAQVFARRVFRAGGCGRGAELKLIVNLVLGLNRAALAEGLALARGLQFDLPLVLEVLRSGAAYSRVMDTKGPKMVVGDFTPQGRLAQHHKDVTLIRQAAANCGVETPLSDVHEQLLAQAIEAGHGGLDNSAVFLAYRRELF